MIARPFIGAPGAFVRTTGRHDYSLAPPARSYLQELGDAGVAVHGVGKIRDLFAGVGIDARYPGATNEEAIASTTELVRSLDSGFVFVNLVDTDQLFGHRHDVPGFVGALRAIDAAVGGLDRAAARRRHAGPHRRPRRRPDRRHTDHTREYAPLLARFDGDGGRRHDGLLADVGASVLRWLTGRDAPALPGESFV